MQARASARRQLCTTDRSALTRPLDLVLHIGSGKTGTTSVQRFLRCNRKSLGALGVFFPQTPGLGRHVALGLLARPDAELNRMIAWRRLGHPSPAEFRNDFRHRLFREIAGSGLSRVLFSDESLYGSSDETLRRLRAFTDEIAGSVRLVVYLRRQDDHLASRYQQVVKTGEIRRLADRVEQLNLSKTYDYYARLRTWARLLEPTEFVVRPFERDRFVDGSLYQDFLAASGIDARVSELRGVDSQNESMDAEAVEFLRILNLYRVEHAAAVPGLIDNQGLARRLAQASTGPTLTLPEPQLDEFMAQWEDSNRAVAREFLGDATGRLFRAPRKTRNTTTEQHLDPPRLDHFLTLLQLPEEMRAPLRRLVEREATARD
jgi:hypothetical protein